MIIQHTARALWVAVTLSSSLGCGRILVEGGFGDRGLDVGGTAIAWIDETEYVAKEAGGAPVLVDRATDQTQLHLIFSGAVFDPRADLRALPAGERAQIENDLDRNDMLRVDIQRGNVVRKGDVISLHDGTGLPPEVLPFLAKVAVLLGAKALDDGAQYPEVIPHLGTALSAKLTVDEVSPDLVGTLKVVAQRNDGDDEDALEGTVKISFGAELLPERLAECNFARDGAGVVDACDLDAR